MKLYQGQTSVNVLLHNYIMKWTSSTFKRHLAFCQDGDDSSSTDFKTMMNVSERGNLATLGQLDWAIYQTPFFVFIFSFNIFLAFTATLGNTLILIALHKVSSIHPPTKCLLRCLAMTDFCVGIIVQPLFCCLFDGTRKWKLAYYLLDFELFWLHLLWTFSHNRYCH